MILKSYTNAAKPVFHEKYSDKFTTFWYIIGFRVHQHNNKYMMNHWKNIGVVLKIYVKIYSFFWKLLFTVYIHVILFTLLISASYSTWKCCSLLFFPWRVSENEPIYDLLNPSPSRNEYLEHAMFFKEPKIEEPEIPDVPPLLPPGFEEPPRSFGGLEEIVESAKQLNTRKD